MLICAPIKKKTKASVFSNFKKAQELADLVEIWFDEINNFNEEDLKNIIKYKKKPIIYKCNDLQNIPLILSEKIDFIDLDMKTPQNIINKVNKLSPKTKIIISYHNFKKTPTNRSLTLTAQKIKAKKADIIKIATYAETFEDSIRMLCFLSELNKKKTPAVCLCMGEKGEITRTAGQLLGNYLMYAPINKKDASAKGQLTIKELKWHLK